MRFFAEICGILTALSLNACGAEPLGGEATVAIAASRDADAGVDASSASPRAFVVQAAGDMLIHPRLNDVARAHGQGSLEAGYFRMLESLRPSLERGDLNLVNMETPIATERNPIGGEFSTLNAAPELAAAMARVGFELAFLANNHAYDQTARGLLETKSALVHHGIETVGGDASHTLAHAPLELSRDGRKLAIFGFTETVNAIDFHRRLRPSAPQVAVWEGQADLDRVRDARAGHDLVVVGFHWGVELDAQPSPFQVATARALCDAGADLVVGTHPHVLQPVDVVARPDGGRCVVAYSLGNLISNQGLKYRLGYVNAEPGKAQGVAATRDGALLRVTYALEDERLVLSALEVVPLWTENNWETRYGNDAFVHDVRVTPVAAAMAALDPASRARRLYEERLGAISTALGGIAMTTF